MPRRDVVDIRNRLHLELLYSCGLRLTESLESKMTDIDLANRSVRIKGKGGKVRVLPLMKDTLAALCPLVDPPCVNGVRVKTEDKHLLELRCPLI